jgi:hypothetical protein
MNTSKYFAIVFAMIGFLPATISAEPKDDPKANKNHPLIKIIKKDAILLL